MKIRMVCFCGCKKYIKNKNGFKIGCITCGHGPQNHEDIFRNKNEFAA